MTSMSDEDVTILMALLSTALWLHSRRFPWFFAGIIAGRVLVSLAGRWL